MITGSVWTGTANQLIGIQVTLDGQPIGSAEIYSNLASTHRSVVPTYIPVKLTSAQGWSAGAEFGDDFRLQ
jgi:hypothetical protein